MKVEKHNEDETIIHYGEEGNTFCIILKGKVGVLIPTINHDESEEEEKDEDEYEPLTEVATLERGDSFGDLCLLENKPRAATIIAKENTWLLVLEKSDFLEILGGVQMAKQTAIINFLYDLPLFEHWSKLALQRI